MLAPLSVEGQLQTGASRHLRRCPKRQQGVAPAKLPLRAPAYEHPQRYLIFVRPATRLPPPPRAATERTRGGGGGFGDGGANDVQRRDRLGQGRACPLRPRGGDRSIAHPPQPTQGRPSPFPSLGSSDQVRLLRRFLPGRARPHGSPPL